MFSRSFNLSLKLTLCLIGSMAIVFLILGYQIVQLHRKNLEEITIASADRISDTIKRSTRYSMLKNHRDELYHIITTIGAEPGISKIRIFNQEGKISFSTAGHELETFVDKKAEACTACHAQGEPLARLNRPDRIRIFTGAKGERILGLINPIENEPSCSNSECHAHPPAKQVLGVLDVTLSLARVDETIALGSRQMVASFVGAILAVPFIVGIPIWLMVHKPVALLIAGTKRVASGNLDYRIGISSRDEIGELAASFNQMTEALKQANNQITDWTRILERRVEEKTEELRRAGERMVQVERMVAIGKLAAIVAHEINNPLTGILTYAKLLLKKFKSNPQLPSDFENAGKHLEVIASESARCGEIVKNLLLFARQSKVSLQPNNLNQLLLESIRLVQHKIDLINLETHMQLEESLPPVVCDAQLIRQALVALLINAIEAVTPGEGILEVLSRLSADRNRVEISIRDNGIGMDEETKRHIFEPFFTTKEQGKGVGLGLAVVYGIISQHSGEIDVKAALGEGTTFTIQLPVRGDGRV